MREIHHNKPKLALNLIVIDPPILGLLAQQSLLFDVEQLFYEVELGRLPEFWPRLKQRIFLGLPSYIRKADDCIKRGQIMTPTIWSFVVTAATAAIAQQVSLAIADGSN